MPKVILSISEELKRKARAKAILQGTSLSAVVRAFLEEWVKDCPDEVGQEGESAE